MQLEGAAKVQGRWEIVLFTLAAAFIIVQLSMTIVINYTIDPAIPTPNVEKTFDEFDNPFDDIAKEIIPFVQDWFQDWQVTADKLEHHTSGLLENSPVRSSSSSTTFPPTNSSCFGLYFIRD